MCAFFLPTCDGRIVIENLRHPNSPVENREFIKEVSGHGFQSISIVENAGHLVSFRAPGLTVVLNIPIFRQCSKTQQA
jgi:hypothetical protein